MPVGVRFKTSRVPSSIPRTQVRGRENKRGPWRWRQARVSCAILPRAPARDVKLDDITARRTSDKGCVQSDKSVHSSRADRRRIFCHPGLGDGPRASRLGRPRAATGRTGHAFWSVGDASATVPFGVGGRFRCDDISDWPSTVTNAWPHCDRHCCNIVREVGQNKTAVGILSRGIVGGVAESTEGKGHLDASWNRSDVVMGSREVMLPEGQVSERIAVRLRGVFRSSPLSG